MAPLDDLPLLNPPEFPDCLVCGPDNPEGLHLRIHRDGTDGIPWVHSGNRLPTWFIRRR